MSSSLITVTLSGSPATQHGFWYSQGFSGLPRGHMLTLSNFWFTIVFLGLGIIITWSVSTLWRIACAALFGVFYRDRLTWEESQNMALIVNSSSAFDACITSGELLAHRRKIRTSPQRDRAKTTLVALAVAGFLVTGLNFGLPFLVALIPKASQGLINPHDCGTLPIMRSDADDERVNGKWSRWANAAFGTIDRNVSDSDADSSTQPGSFPKITPSYVDSCPGNVSVCSSEHPFTFSTNYTLSREHFSINLDIPFSLQVFDTCYRPIQATGQVNGSNPEVTAFGLYYGPLNLTGGVQEYTELTFKERRYSAGYTVSQYSALAKDSELTSIWTPNSTLVMGGDTTLLFYYVGAVSMSEQSSDPIFATGPPYSTGLYLPSNLVVPIVCDTKYVFCADGKGDCSAPGGLNDMLRWMNKKEGEAWKDVSSVVNASLIVPPIFQASLGSVAVLASETTHNGLYQYEPKGVTARKELERLVNAGMMMVASYAQLSVTGYWNVGNGSTGLDLNNAKSICKSIVMYSNSSKVNTIPVIPYAILLVFLLLTILAGKVELLPRGKLSSSYRDLLDAWTLHSSGQLHREVTERIRGRFQKIDTTADWPTVETYHLGPAVVTQNDTKRFASAGDDDKVFVSTPSSASIVMKNSPDPFAPQYSQTSFFLQNDAPLSPPTPGGPGCLSFSEHPRVY